MSTSNRIISENEWHQIQALREKNKVLSDALIDVRNAYQQLFDVMPVAWQTYAEIVDSAIATNSL